MNAPGEGVLDEVLGADRRAQLESALGHQGRRIELLPRLWRKRGFTDARLVAVVLENLTPPHQPVPCILKLCLPSRDGDRGRSEGARHRQAQDQAPDPFQRRLTGLACDPITLADGSVVLMQEPAAGRLSSLDQLGDIQGPALPRVYDRIRACLHDDWVQDRYERESADASQLLVAELGRSVGPEGWLEAWARAHRLLEAAAELLVFEDGVCLPNPLRLLTPAAPASPPAMTYLVGRSHGDLHGGNVLLPRRPDGQPDPDEFMLVDLATYETAAPLSRDVATLLMSLATKRVSAWVGAPELQDGLADLIVDGDDRGALPPEVTGSIQALRRPGRTFVRWTEPYERQLDVSLLAQALLHSSYDSLEPPCRLWSFRVAARLTRKLLPDWPSSGRPLPVALPLFGSAPSDTASTRQRGGTRAGPDARPIVDRQPERQRLIELLRDPGSALILVAGSAGAGKSAVVDDVLATLENGTEDVRVHRHRAAPMQRPDVMTLIQDVELDEEAPGLTASQSALLRLDTALDALAGYRTVIVLESAEHLVTADGGLIDEDLDVAFEAIARHQTARLKLVLVGVSQLTNPIGQTWPMKLHRVPVEPLDPGFFREFAASLVSRQYRGVGRLASEVVDDLRGLLRGNLRHVELLDVLFLLGGGIRPDNVVARLSQLPSGEISQVLTDQLVSSLPRGPRTVLLALAAVGTAVDRATVDRLAQPDGIRVEDITDALERLLSWHVVRRVNDGRYYVPAADRPALLLHVSDGAEWPVNGSRNGTSTLHRAAELLPELHVPREQITRLRDLDTYLAEIDVLIRLGEHDKAHGVIELVDPILRRWNRGDLLLQSRAAVNGRLTDSFDRMQNHNALGHLHMSRGRFADAAQEYDAALAESAGSHAAPRPLILLNTATMHLECNRTDQAMRVYRTAFSLASEAEAHEARSGALAGMANCHRRRGEYRDALGSVEEARCWADRISSRRAVGLALKAARWRAELGEMDEARRMQALAEEDAVRHDEPALLAACMDGRADLLLDVDHPERAGEAMDAARQALNLAGPLRDPVITVQSRTTLGMAYLLQGHYDRADLEIRIAARYRRPRRALLVVALQASLARLRRNPPLSHALFAQLASEAMWRRSRDPKDFAAWDFEGLALTGMARRESELEPAMAAFRTARQLTPAPQGLVRRLACLLGLMQLDHPPGSFQAVFAALAESEVGPTRS